MVPKARLLITWSPQVFILDALAKYDPVDSREAEQMIDRVLPRLAHQNAAVVLSAVKIVMKYVREAACLAQY